MVKRIPYSGFCPTQKMKYTVTQEWIDVTNVTDGKKKHVKGLLDCEYAGMHTCPLVKQCPLIEDEQ